MEEMRYLAFDVGCYECSEPSGIIGFYATEEEAKAACVRANERQRANWKGQHSMQVHALESRSEFADGE